MRRVTVGRRETPPAPDDAPTYVHLRHALTYTTCARFQAPKTPQERHMTAKRPNEPIAPANIPGQKSDPKIPPEEIPKSEDGLLESEAERKERESKRGFPSK